MKNLPILWPSHNIWTLEWIISGSTQLSSKFHTTESIKFFLLYKLNCYFLNILQIITLKDNCYLIHIMAEFVLFLNIFLSRNFLKTYKMKIFLLFIYIFLVIVRKILFFFFKKLGFGIKHEHLWWLAQIMVKNYKLLPFSELKIISSHSSTFPSSYS